MSTSSKKHNSSTTVPPANAGDKSAASERNSALTVELSPSTAPVDSEGKTSILTTGPAGSDFVLSGSAITISSDETVIRNGDNPQERTDSYSSNANSLSAHKSSNENVEFVNNSAPFDYDLTNKLFGIYYVQQKIGGGGMGDVYLAKDTLLDRDVALKVLTPNQQSEEFRERFIIEAKASAKLHHDNIVTVYSFGEINGRIYLAMEYIPGVNLRVKEKKEPLSIEETLSYAIQLSAALEHIHQKGIVHRDIKPSNVIITDDGTAKIIDLGLAKDFGMKKNANEPKNDLTQTGVTLGTFDYISPEQARDPRNVDIRSDIYSLGCTIFFMLTASPPYPDGNGLQKLLSHQGDTPPNVQDERADVPDSLAGIVMRCMAKNPEMRYQTPQDLTKALYIAAEERGMRPSELSMTKWYFPVRSRLKIWKDRLWWAVPIVFLFVGIVLLDYIWRPNQRQSEFLPETPGLKRRVVTVNSGGRGSSIFGMPVKRGKVLEFEDVPQSFPQPPEITPTDFELTQPPFTPENPNATLSPVPTTSIPPDPASTAPPAVNTSQVNDSTVPDNSVPRKSIHSVKVETD